MEGEGDRVRRQAKENPSRYWQEMWDRDPRNQSWGQKEEESRASKTQGTGWSSRNVQAQRQTAWQRQEGKGSQWNRKAQNIRATWTVVTLEWSRTAWKIKTGSLAVSKCIHCLFTCKQMLSKKLIVCETLNWALYLKVAGIVHITWMSVGWSPKALLFYTTPGT